MESSILETQKSDKEYPSNTGKKWTDEEEILLLEELSKNINMQVIAQNHHRTCGGINARRREIAYKLHSKNNSMEEIISKTKLDEAQIIETIQKREKYSKKSKEYKQSKPAKEIKKPFSIENEIDEMKIEIKELKNTIKEVVNLIKPFYEVKETHNTK
jgi:hypothetical protein